MKVYPIIIMLLLMSIDARLKRIHTQVGTVMFRIILKNINIHGKNKPFKEVFEKSKYLKKNFNSEGLLLNQNSTGSKEEIKGKIENHNPFNQSFELILLDLATQALPFQNGTCPISTKCISSFVGSKTSD